MNSQRLYPPVRRQLEESLCFLFEHQSASSKVINYSFKTNKKWGSRDRKAFAEAFYFIVRNAGMYFEKLHIKDFQSFDAESFKEVVGLYLEDLQMKPNQEHFRWSVSRELLEVLSQDLSPQEKQDFLEASSHEAAVFLRKNTLKVSEDSDFERALQEEGVEVSKVKNETYKLLERKNIFQTQAFKKGFFEIQDGASQDVAPFLQVEPNMRVADTCAGAGGKSLHLSACMENKGKIVAMDISARRLEELKKRSRRAGAHNIEIKEIQNNKTLKRLQKTFDRVLIDAPCTGTGTYRRKPESKIFFSQDELGRLLQTQEEVLLSHSKLVKPGGKLVYATCSVLPSENKKQVEKFLESQTDFQWEDEKENKVGQDGFDGFYMARLSRKA